MRLEHPSTWSTSLVRLCCINGGRIESGSLRCGNQAARSTELLGGEFKWRHFAGELILLCVRWYCRYGISYRDLEEMMGERGVVVDHTTLYRWVQRYAPELEKRTL